MTNELKTKRSDVFHAILSDIEVNFDENIREDYGNIEELMFSILENGVKKPLTAFKKGGKFIVTDGYRRMKAIYMALENGFTQNDLGLIPLISDRKNGDKVGRIFDMFILNDGKSLTPLEQGKLFTILVEEEGLNGRDIAKKVGKSDTYVYKMMKVFKGTDDEIKEEIKQGNVSATLAHEILEKSEGNIEKAKEIINKGKEKSKGKTVTKKHIKEELEITPEIIETEKEVPEISKPVLKILSKRELLIQNSGLDLIPEMKDLINNIADFLEGKKEVGEASLFINNFVKENMFKKLAK